jgi:hypothetical protein
MPPARCQLALNYRSSVLVLYEEIPPMTVGVYLLMPGKQLLFILPLSRLAAAAACHLYDF